jgi:hypothetical protein
MEMRVLRAASRWVIPVLLSGCASVADVADSVVDGNKAQETAANQMVLLNIARAAERAPMHFSRMQAIRMPLAAGSPSFKFPSLSVGSGRSHVWGFDTSTAVSQSVDTQVQDSQEFMQGITQPVPPAVMEYYLDQGWPKALILHMFVRVIEIYEKPADGSDPKVVARMENYPGRLADFQQAVQSLESCVLNFESRPVPKTYGAFLKADEVKDLRGLAALKAAEIAVTPVDSTGAATNTLTLSGFRLARVSNETEFTLSGEMDKDCHGIEVPMEARGKRLKEDAFKSAKVIPLKVGTFKAESGPLSTKALSIMSTMSAARSTSLQTTATFFANLKLRSPEAMLYYLGEIVRGGKDGPLLNQGGWAPDAVASPANPALFKVSRATVAEPFVTVEYAGKTYSVAKSSDDNRATHVLSLVTQVLSLQNKGSAAPATSNVRLVN